MKKQKTIHLFLENQISNSYGSNPLNNNKKRNSKTYLLKKTRLFNSMILPSTLDTGNGLLSDDEINIIKNEKDKLMEIDVDIFESKVRTRFRSNDFSINTLVFLPLK